MRSAKEILERYRSGRATQEEQAWVERWWLTHNVDDSVELTEKKEAELSKVMSRSIDKLIAQRPSGFRWLPYAAAVILVIIAGLLWRIQAFSMDKQPSASDILPGSHRAVLTYSDGTKVDLSEKQGGIVIGEELTYLDGSAVATPREADSELLLTTPKGGTYQAVLPDGTHVWLNAASTLRYPSTFKDGRRIVELKGEAYFDVKKIQEQGGFVPFVVKTEGQVVSVLGTTFNISAYPDDRQTKTTLETGIVEVYSLADNATKRLKPGEQSRIGKGEFEIAQVDVDTEIGWKNGYFNFNRSNIDDVLKQFSRWYDVDFVYTGKKEGIKLSGSIHRNVSADKALSILDYFDMKYRIKDTKKDGIHVLVEDN